MDPRQWKVLRRALYLLGECGHCKSCRAGVAASDVAVLFEIGRCCVVVSPMCCVVAVLTLVIVLSFVACLFVVGYGRGCVWVSLGVAAFSM